MECITKNRLFINPKTNSVIITTPNVSDNHLHRFYADEVISMSIKYELNTQITTTGRGERKIELFIERNYYYTTIFGNYNFPLMDRLTITRESFLRKFLVYCYNKYRLKYPEEYIPETPSEEHLNLLFRNFYYRNFYSDFENPLGRYKFENEKEKFSSDQNDDYYSILTNRMSDDQMTVVISYNIYSDHREMDFILGFLINYFSVPEPMYSIIQNLFRDNDLITILNEIGFDMSIFEPECDPILKVVNSVPLKRQEDVLN